MIIDFLNSINEKGRYNQDGKLIIDSRLSNLLMSAIKEGRAPLKMDERDLNITCGEGMPNFNLYSECFNSLDDIVAVHLSPVAFENDTISTVENAGVTKTIYFIDPNTGVNHEVTYPVGKDTIHFTLNCVVQNHEVGNDWNSYKYGILTDFKDLDNVLDVKSEDTFVDGNVDLKPGYFLFCPAGEREELSKRNPNATIIEYEGISLSDAISILILYSGHKLEPYGVYGWGRDNDYLPVSEDNRKLESLVLNEGYPVLKGEAGNLLHSETKYMARRMWKIEYEALINLIEYNKENNIDMPKDVIDTLLLYNGVYSLPGTIKVTIDDYKEVVLPILEKHGYDIDDSLFDGLEFDEEIKMVIPSASGEIPRVGFTQWEHILRDRIIDIVLSKEKRKSPIN